MDWLDMYTKNSTSKIVTKPHCLTDREVELHNLNSIIWSDLAYLDKIKEEKEKEKENKLNSNYIQPVELSWSMLNHLAMMESMTRKMNRCASCKRCQIPEKKAKCYDECLICDSDYEDTNSTYESESESELD